MALIQFLLVGNPLLAFRAASAQEEPLVSDRAAIDGCLQKQKDAPEHCIGVVYKACTEEPSGSSTAGMGFCAQRETKVWQEKIEASLDEMRAGALGKKRAEPWNRPPENRRERAVAGADIIDDMQRTWLAWRAKMCDTASLQYEGGSLSRVVYGECIYEETARHALWLKALLEDTQ